MQEKEREKEQIDLEFESINLPIQTSSVKRELQKNRQPMLGVLPTNMGQGADDRGDGDDDYDEDQYDDDEEDSDGDGDGNHLDVEESQVISNKIDILDEAEALLIEDSQKLDDAFSILNDPLAISIALKKQYDDVATKGQ